MFFHWMKSGNSTRECGKPVLAPQYVVEAKIDGLSISLEYRNGVLFGLHLGDGIVGKT